MAIIDPILPIKGVPDDLLKAINVRLRLIDTSAKGQPGTPGRPGAPGTPGDGGGGAVTDAPNVVIDGAEVREVYDGKFEIDVDWHPDMAATPDTFRGAAVYLEDPDISSAADAPMDNTQPLDGTAQLSGKWQPKRETDSFDSPAVVTVPGQDADRDVRIYLSSFGPAANNKLVRANELGGTPSIKVTVPKRTFKSVSGREYAWLVTDASVLQVDDFDNPEGPKYHLIFSYTPPDPSIPLPPGMGPFAGVQIVYEYDSGSRAPAGFLAVDHPEDWISDNYDAVGSGHFRVWFVSTDDAGNQNTIVPGVTPVVDVTVTYPPVDESSAPDVTGFTITDAGHKPLPDGTIYALANFAWNNPDSGRYSLMTIWRIDPLPVKTVHIAVPPESAWTYELIDWPKTAEVWTFAAISSDNFGTPAADPNVLPLPSHIPTATWNVGPPGLGGSGEEYTTFVDITGVRIDTEQEISSDGIQMMRHKIQGWINPGDNTFGGVSIARVQLGDLGSAVWWDAGKTDTVLTTAWEPAVTERDFDFYFVSRDMQNRRNTILPGFTPKVTIHFIPTPGKILTSRLPKDWFDTTEFAWPPDLVLPGDGAGKFIANVIGANKIFVGSILRVGGGTISTGSSPTAPSFAGVNGQIAVFNASNVLRAWMGQQGTATPDNPASHQVFGGWFAELYVGGDGPPTAPLYAKQDGTVIVGGFDVAGGRYPYISLRDNTGVEVGRMGARIGYAPTGNQTGPEFTIQGAWFREFAYGGLNFGDWRMLAKMDTGGLTASVQMRNVNTFTVDYAQSYNPGGTYPNPSNAANRLQFGYDAYIPKGSGSSFYKFPGITLYRQTSTGVTPTTHGIDLINRGLVLKGPNAGSSSGSPVLGAFVSFNGDNFGSDVPSTFWASLLMNNPFSGNQNVLLESQTGYPTVRGSAHMYLMDQFGTVMFEVADNIAVKCLKGVSVLSYDAITSTGDFHAESYYIHAGTTNTQVINNSCTIRTPDDVHARHYFCQTTTPTVTDAVVIDGIAKQFVGSGGVNCSNPSGPAPGIWTTGDIRAGTAFFIAGTQGFPNSAGTTTFTTADGKTVTVKGGLIINIV